MSGYNPNGSGDPNLNMNSRQVTVAGIGSFIAKAMPGTQNSAFKWQIALNYGTSPNDSVVYLGGTPAFVHAYDAIPCYRLPEYADDLENITAGAGIVIKDSAGVRKRMTITDIGAMAFDPIGVTIDATDIEIPGTGFGLVIKSPSGQYWRFTPTAGDAAGNWDPITAPSPADLAITAADKGLILAAPNGSRWRFTPSDTGTNCIEGL